MATSTIKLYSVGFGIDQNAKLDSISDYLETLTPLVINDFQLVKHDLDIFIKVNLNQSQAFQSSYNYVSIKNSDITRTYYYYIIKTEWVAQSTVKLYLSIDDLNTFADLLVFTSKTAIQREHKDRFIKPATVSAGPFFATRIVDKIDEGLTGLVKYNDSSRTISSSMKKWYLVYCNNQGLNVGDTNSNNAINCYLVPETDTEITVGSTSYTGYDIASSQSSYRIFTSNNLTVTINGVSYTNTSSRHYGFGRYTTNTSGFVVYIEGTTVTRVTYNIDLGNSISFSADTGATALLTPDSGNTWALPIYDALDKNNVTYDTDGTYTISSINSVNRTLSYLVKIIECPYPPLDINTSVSDGSLAPIYTKELNSAGIYALKLSKLESDFKYQIYTSWNLGEFQCSIPSRTSRLTTLKDITYESKMYHNSIFSKIFTYDSFTLDIPYEELSGTAGDTPSVDIYYKQSNAINSALYFDFQMHRGTWSKVEALENIMVCNRNNEMPIYNSSYLDYIRTGYNFDKKAKNLQIAQGLWNTGLNVGGSALSFGLSGITKGISAVGGVSMLTNSIRSISNNIFTNITTRNQLEQKKAEAKATASSIQTSDDLNLLNGYLGNKLFLFTYSASDTVKSKIFELFYKCGYASYKAGIPNTSSRYRFNYLECEADFSTKNNPEWKQYLEDVMERFRKGVTYFHRYDDFEQTLENWETWMITE